jgi:hypothetical protein
MNKAKILKKLKNDEDYYGDFGNQFLSNSHVGRLLNDPLNIFKPMKPSPAFLIGGYFHTCILEPNKLDKYKVVKSTSRNTKAYKDVAGGELCLLQQEVDMIELMREKVMDNDICRDLIQGTGMDVEYEVPMITDQIGMFDCSPKFYERGEDKVRRASEAYDLFYKTKDFDPKQYFISKTL